ncbi:anhydro-N-acetylmuramic acid kinase [Vibrio gallicus]|uniref:anhydro-N-acetylmuramic acid kinase n=1 Tax=Vibrio gallicus TaxID=190897 RepID=UPI0021C3271E|nr:anhydro-N-acetylmuramic acid kinase [Vibrio gallicus]
MKEKYIGIMSGTSLDGVDLALASFENGNTQCLATFEYPIPWELKQKTLAVCQGQATTLAEIGELNQRFARLYSEATIAFLTQHSIERESITAIGCHGQTVFHQPTGPFPFTTQIGDPNYIAIHTGIKVVADFRSKDIALGGQGAPLVPAYHQTLFSREHSTKVVLNIGGIANISVLKPDTSVLGYDTGPGNMLMDAWIHRHQAKPYDKQGKLAQQGSVNSGLLEQLMTDPFLGQAYPKSTGREHYNLAWLDTQLQNFSDISVADVQATLLEFTARSISEQCQYHAHGNNNQLMICGGGANNPALVSRIKQLVPTWQVTDTDAHGISSDYMEALAFAWLAHRRIHQLPSNLPQVTGAREKTSLGVIYLPN